MHDDPEFSNVPSFIILSIRIHQQVNETAGVIVQYPLITFRKVTRFLSKQGFLKLRSHVMGKRSVVPESWTTLDSTISSSQRVNTRPKIATFT